MREICEDTDFCPDRSNVSSRRSPDSIPHPRLLLAMVFRTDNNGVLRHTAVSSDIPDICSCHPSFSTVLPLSVLRSPAHFLSFSFPEKHRFSRIPAESLRKMDRPPDRAGSDLSDTLCQAGITLLFAFVLDHILKCFFTPHNGNTFFCPRDCRVKQTAVVQLSRSREQRQDHSRIFASLGFVNGNGIGRSSSSTRSNGYFTIRCSSYSTSRVSSYSLISLTIPISPLKIP